MPRRIPSRRIPGDEIEIDAWGNTRRVGSEADIQASHLGKRPGESISPVSVDKKRLRVEPPQAPMADVPSSAAPAAPVAKAAASMAASTSTGTGETPVDMHEPELGLFGETHTAILPLRFGCSFVRISNTTFTNVLKIRMNAPYNILKDSTFVLQTEATAAATGLSTHQTVASATNNADPLASFETTLIPSTAPTASTSGSGVVADAQCIPAWRAWFEKIYESYHVVETQYRITFVSGETTVGNRTRVYVDKDVYTTSSTGNIMPVDATPLSLNSVFPDVDTIIVSERNNNDDNGWRKQITGVWRPDTWSKNTLNAEDIKGWYATGAEPTPAWNENLVLVARPDEYSVNYPNLNVFVELRYVVQFKDKKVGFRYPQSTDTAVSLNTPADIIQVPATRFAWGSEI